ncbi:MAG: DUF6884 domain-containing protein [Methanobacterium sp.]
MKEICIVVPGKKKIWDKTLKGPVKSKEIYTGSFTRKCIEFAEEFYKNSYCILSAKYGFLDGEEVIEGPYNECFHLKDSHPISKETLQLQIKEGKMDDVDKIIVLGGKYYTEFIKDLFPLKEVFNPLTGLTGIGKMMKKLNDLIEKKIEVAK